MSRRPAKQPNRKRSPERTRGPVALFQHCLREQRWSVAANVIADRCERLLQIEREDRIATRSVEDTRAASAEWSQLIGHLDQMMIAGCIPFRGGTIVGQYEHSDPGIFLDWCANWISTRAGDVAG